MLLLQTAILTILLSSQDAHHDVHDGILNDLQLKHTSSDSHMKSYDGAVHPVLDDLMMLRAGIPRTSARPGHIPLLPQEMHQASRS